MRNLISQVDSSAKENASEEVSRKAGEPASGLGACLQDLRQRLREDSRREMTRHCRRDLWLEPARPGQQPNGVPVRENGGTIELSVAVERAGR